MEKGADMITLLITGTIVLAIGRISGYKVLTELK